MGVHEALAFMDTKYQTKIIELPNVRTLLHTGAENITSHRLCEYEVKKLCSPACSRQLNAIFPPLIHLTLPEPFSGALYNICLAIPSFHDHGS